MKNMTNMKNRLILATLGMAAITFGIAFIIVLQHRYGSGSFEAMCEALRVFFGEKLGIGLLSNIGLVITAVSLITIAIAYLIRRNYRQIPVVSIVLAFVFGMLTDFWIDIVGIGGWEIIKASDVILVPIMFLNITLVTIGACFMICANLGLTPLDYFVDTIAKKTGKSFGTAKLLFEIVIVLVMLAVSFGVGATSQISFITFTLGVIIGFEIKYILPFTERIFKKHNIIK